MMQKCPTCGAEVREAGQDFGGATLVRTKAKVSVVLGMNKVQLIQHIMDLAKEGRLEQGLRELFGGAQSVPGTDRTGEGE